MPDVLLSALLPAVMRKATDHVLQQFGLMWGIHEKLEKLRRMLSAIQDKLGDAEERQSKEAGVNSWLASLKDKAYEADDILDEFNVEAMRRRAEIQIDMTKKVRSFFSLHNPVRFRFKMGRKLNDIVEKIEKLVNEGNTFGFTVRTQPQNRDRPQTHSYVDESHVIGREEDKEKIVKLLLDHDSNQNVAVLPIVGMGGLGKTTLAQLICKDDRVVEHFQPLIWVCVSEEFDVAKLAKAIIASATGVECELSNMELLQRRLREVVSGKSYLLVLDDIWSEDQAKWNQLKTLLETGGEGSRIIVTTRSERASSIMGTLDTYSLQRLTEDDSWKLFRKRAFKEGAEEPQNLVSIGREIVRKCGGLPLAVNALGSLMRYKSEEREWQSVRDSETWDIGQGGEDSILRALRLSYSHLPSHLKQCFAFCAIFPKDYEMKKDLLIQLWMANGFIPSEGRKGLEDKGHEIFNELAWRSFFQDVKEAEDYRAYAFWGELPYRTTCKMHDLMHDLARSIMGNECLSILDPARLEDKSTKTRHLSTWHLPPDVDIYRTLNNYPNIRTLLYVGFFNIVEVTADSSKTKSLRVLDLHNSSITRLPIAIGYLKHLRYLDLSGTDIEALPDATRTLFNLQTLKLSGCSNLRKLPEDMRQMSNLRHLYINGCTNLKHMPADMGQLRSLQTLTTYIVGNDAGTGIGQLNGLNLGGLLELCNLRNVRDAAEARQADMCSKQSLRSLILCWDMNQADQNVEPAENAEEILEAFKTHRGLKFLKISHYGGGSFPTWMMDSQLLQNLVKLELKVCTGCQHLPPLWQLPSLKCLYIFKMDSVQHICSSTINGNASNGRMQAFPSLKRLTLDTMQSLEQWSECEGATEITLVFPQLAELKIIDCPNLMTMPELPSLAELGIINCPNLMTMPELPSLKSLKLDRTNKQLGLSRSLTTTPSSLDILVYKTSHVTESPSLAQKKISFRSFKSLEYLSITRSDGWFSSSQRSSPPLGLWKDITSLLTLRIEDCDDLVHWPEEEFRGLNSLKELSLIRCNKLAGLSPSPLSSSSSGDGELLPNLEKLNIENCNSLLELPKLPASLRSLYVRYCPKLNSLTEALSSSSSRDGELLPNLEHLDIEHCDGLLELPKLPASLRSLSVGGCPQLNSLTEALSSSSSGNGELLPNLEHLRLEDCDGLLELPKLPASLRSLSVDGCPTLNSLTEGLRHAIALENVGIRSLPGLTCLPQGFGQLTALKDLYITNCSNLSSLPEGLQGLTALQLLSIRRCPRLWSLPEGLQQRLPSLQHLVIEGCPNLERQCKRGGPYWHQVSRIPDAHILSERGSSFSTHLPSFSCFRRPSTV